MRVIKINFVDFWAGFIKEDNYFVKLLSKQYEVQFSDDPDFLIYSCYGEQYLKYKCIKIFFSPENQRPDFLGCDFALTCDFMDHPRQYRLPLYSLYIDAWKQTENVLRVHTAEEMKAAWQMKKKFCSMVVSNGKAKERTNFFNELSRVRQVDSGGRFQNNVGGPVKNKLEFIKDYKFVFSFENSSYPGYVTEKLIEPCFVHSIPIYWGNPIVEKDFNPKRFINRNDFPNNKALIKRIMEIDKNDDMAIEIISQPIFNRNVFPETIKEENVLNFFRKIFEGSAHITPVATTPKDMIHRLKNKHRKLKSRIYYHLGLGYR